MVRRLGTQADPRDSGDDDDYAKAYHVTDS